MIETSLINLYEAVKAGQKLLAGTKVVLPTGGEAEIYGFIATGDSIFSEIIDMPPLGECKVFSNRVIFNWEKKVYRFPIFHSVCLPSKEKYELYLLYVIKLLYSPSDRDRKNYLESMCEQRPNQNVGSIENVHIEENIAYYYTNGNDLYFKSRSKLRGIGTNFVIITRRISKLSGDIKYEVFDSYSVKTERL